MAGNKHLDKKIRDSYESAAPKAPEGLWSAMEEALSTPESTLDAKVKESFESAHSSPPEAVWAGINRQLTIDKAWLGINRYLNRRAAYIWTGRIAALLLLAFGAFWFYPFSQSTKSNHEYLKIDLRDRPLNELKGYSFPSGETQSSKFNQESNPAENAPLAETFKAAAILTQNPAPDLPLENSSTIENPNRIAHQKASPFSEDQGLNALYAIKRSDLARQPSILPPNNRFWDSLNMAEVFAPLQVYALNAPLSIPLKKRTSSTLSKWELGFEYSFNRDFLSNNIARESQDPRSLVNSSAVYSNNYKLVMHYRFHPKWSLKLALQPNRQMALAYSTYREGQYVQEQLSLNFHRLGLGLAHHLPLGRMSSPWSLNLGLEPYYAYLDQALDNKLDRTESYTSAYGLQLRLGQEWRRGNLILSLGIETDFNFNNLYKGDARIPSDFDRTLYRSWSAYLGMRYSLF